MKEVADDDLAALDVLGVRLELGDDGGEVAVGVVADVVVAGRLCAHDVATELGISCTEQQL